MFVETEKFAAEFEAMGPDDRARAYGLVETWIAQHADKIRGGNKLQPAHTATTVRLDQGAEPVISDGGSATRAATAPGGHRPRAPTRERTRR